MEAKEFFSFGSKLVSSNVDVYAMGLKTKEHCINDRWKLFKGQYSRIEFPVVFKQERKGKFNDILDTGWVSLFIISERMKNILEDNKLTGWQVFPIRLYDLHGKEMSGYYGLSIVGHCGPVSYDHSKIIEKRFVPHGPLVQYYKGVSFDGWDGADFFAPDKTYDIFITKRAAQILKKNKISNMAITNLAEQEIDVSVAKMGLGDAATSIIEYDTYKACEIDDSSEGYR